MTFATTPEALVRHSKAVLDHVREHLAGRHNETAVEECLACDWHRLDQQNEQLRAELDIATAERDQLRERVDGDAWDQLTTERDQLRAELAKVTGERDDALLTLQALLTGTSEVTPDTAPLTGWYCNHCPIDPITRVIQHTAACPEMPEAVKLARGHTEATRT